MKDVLWSAFEIAVNLFEALVAMHFVCAFLGENVKSRTGFMKWAFISFLTASITTGLNALFSYEGILSLVYIFTVLVFALIFLKGNILEKVFVSFLTYGTILTVSRLWTSLITATLNIEMDALLTQSGLIRFLTILIVQVTDLFLFHLLIQLFGKGHVHLQKQEWLLLLMVLLLSASVMVCMQIAELRDNFSKFTKVLFLCVDVFIVMINLFTIEMIVLLNRRNQEQMEMKRLQMQLQYQTQYATAVQQQEQTIMRLRHDMKHNMTVIRELVDAKSEAKLRKYLEQYAEQFRQMISFVHTNNVCVDAIINTKLTYAQENGIDVLCRIDANLPQIREIDYCTLLGNLLDNAIEASQNNLTHSEIILEISNSCDQLSIIVKNRIDTSVLNKNPKLHTSKPLSSEHGFGIQSILEIAERYDGTADFYEDNSYFIAHITLLPPQTQQ